MTLAAWYPQIKLAHMGFAAASGLFFMLRGAGTLARARWPLARAARWTSMALDSALLAAGATLWGLLGLAPWRDAWLGTKLLEVLIYVVLGSFALKRGRSPRQRAAFFAAALVVYAQVAATAVAHSPLGLLHWIF